MENAQNNNQLLLACEHDLFAVRWIGSQLLFVGMMVNYHSHLIKLHSLVNLFERNNNVEDFATSINILVKLHSLVN